jgi:hypothetical protein
MEPDSCDPTVKDVELLRAALTQKGVATPASIETMGFEYLRWVRRLCNEVMRERDR